MNLIYHYKDFQTTDIREIIQNGKFEINKEFISKVYLPYQIFVNGETFFKGVWIEAYGMFHPQMQKKVPDGFKLEFKRPEGRFAAAVSGGIDSSTVAMKTRPDVIYTGYYREPGFSEVPYAQSVAGKIGAIHHTFEITEDDFIDNIDSYLRAICTPIAGLGGVSEMICLQKLLQQEKDIKDVYFGNGGDEVFMGYFYNHLIRELMEIADRKHPYMDNFEPQRKSFLYGNMDLLIERLINRGEQHDGLSPIMKRLSKVDDRIMKMLDININCTLPALLHINNQMCLANGVRGHNPLSDGYLFDYAVDFNTPLTERPKKRLVELCPELPDEVKDRTDKQGFPIPFHQWKELQMMIRSSVQKAGENFTGINRRAWGLFMIDRWKNVFKNSLK